MTHEEANQKFTTKLRRRIFAPILRSLNPQLAEERMAEAVAMTWLLYTNHAALGIELPDALLVHCARLRATDTSRTLVGVGQGNRARADDVLAHHNFAEGKVRVLHLDGALVDDHGHPTEEGDPELEEELLRAHAPDLLHDPTRHLDAALDLGRWLAQLGTRDRQMVMLREQGCTLAEIAEQVGSSISYVCHRLAALGLELAAHAGIRLIPRHRQHQRRSTRPAREAELAA